jgi:hypothetical protein
MRLHEKGGERHEIEQVPDGVSFLKFASRPEWLRLRLPMREQPKVALAFIPLR